MKDNELIHWWNFPDDIYVLIKKTHRIRLFGEPLYRIAKRLNVSRSTVLGWYRAKWKNKVQFMPVWAIKKLHEFYNLGYLKTEKNIISYRAINGNIIGSPKLPIKESPELFQIIGHLYADGYGGDIKGAIPNYCNTSLESREEFIKLLRVCFGDVPYNHMPRHHVVSFSKAIVKIIKIFYGIDDFRSSKSRIPLTILQKPNNFLKSLIKAFIIDESCIRDPGVDIYCGNFELLSNIKKICIKLSYETSSIKIGSGVFYIKIHSKSIPKLIRDMEKIPHKEKQEKLELQLFIKNRGWFFKKRGETRTDIINLLKTKPRTISELCSLLGISSKSIGDFHLLNLEREKIVKRDKSNKEHMWSLNRQVSDKDVKNKNHYKRT